jgi:hypothetical protein
MFSKYELLGIYEIYLNNCISFRKYFNSIQIMLADSDLRLTGGTNPDPYILRNRLPENFSI